MLTIPIISSIIVLIGFALMLVLLLDYFTSNRAYLLAVIPIILFSSSYVFKGMDLILGSPSPFTESISSNKDYKILFIDFAYEKDHFFVLLKLNAESNPKLYVIEDKDKKIRKEMKRLQETAKQSNRSFYMTTETNKNNDGTPVFKFTFNPRNGKPRVPKEILQ